MESPLLSNDDEHIVDIEMTADDYASLIYTLVSIPIATALNSIEFVMTLVQIVVAILVVKGTKGEYPEATWILVYAYGSIANLPILCWRFWQIRHPVSHLRINRVMFRLRTIFECFFAGWFVVFFWVFVCSSSSVDHSSQLFWLCVVFLVFGCIRYVLPMVICAATCCCVFMTLCFNAVNT
ncbi:unnamed protein product [Arabidopsis thaliana]|uniref:Transmembrane protein n=2 Tax=Arabidopsis TaxID=3701 RepID=A0A5S9UK85_ARATH|nr:hypothetical protein ISN44_As01g016020 [Arabidopsis suecica]CAA0207888.1 unnamed protein product [Arabidopsis thaliana]VYS46192.1 unnamed protein product [Arabidopsis thaliana]